MYTLAANQGYADAQYNLGCMYVRGEGIEQSDSKAREFKRIGIDQKINQQIIQVL